MTTIGNCIPSPGLAATMTLALACGDQPHEGPAGSSGQEPAALTSPRGVVVQRAMRAYERIRAALAADHGQVAAAARELAAAADAAAAEAPADSRAHLSAMAAEGRERAATSATDVAGLRRQFGDLSRTVLALLEKERSLADGLHAFQCGMAEGYGGRWVQPSADVSNAYMSTRVPECGAPSDMEPG